MVYFSSAASVKGLTAKTDCGIDAASILELFMEKGKICSRFLSVAVNNKPRTIDLLHMTYSQKSLIGSGGYFPEDVKYVKDIIVSKRWDPESIITHEFNPEGISKAIETASDSNISFNATIKFD